MVKAPITKCNYFNNLNLIINSFNNSVSIVARHRVNYVICIFSACIQCSFEISRYIFVFIKNNSFKSISISSFIFHQKVGENILNTIEQQMIEYEKETYIADHITKCLLCENCTQHEYKNILKIVEERNIWQYIWQ